MKSLLSSQEAINQALTIKKKAFGKNLGGVPEKQSWYQQSGQGMLASIKIAEEKKV